MVSGIGADSNNTKSIADELEEAIEIETNMSEALNTTMKTGNINATLEAVDDLSKVHIKADIPSTPDEVEVSGPLDQKKKL